MTEWLTSIITEVAGNNSTDGPYISIKRLGKQAFISYVDTNSQYLKFAYTPDGTKQDLSPSDWTITTVDDTQNITPKYTSIQVIELNSVTRVYISYYAGNKLKLATTIDHVGASAIPQTGAWVHSNIDPIGGGGNIFPTGLYSSLFVSSTGQVFIAYVADYSTPGPILKYAFYEPQNPIPEFPNPNDFKITTINPDTLNVEYYGMYCSIAVYETPNPPSPPTSRVWISYQSYDSDNTGKKSLYLTWSSDGTNWANNTTLNHPFGGFVQPDADTPIASTVEHGFNTSIYNIGNSLYISHREINSSGGNSLDKIRYVYSQTGHYTWHVTDSTVYSVNNTASQGGRQTSIQVDGAGKVQIVYFDDNAKNLMYSSTPDGTSSPTWTNVAVDSTSDDAGKYPSLSLGSGGFIAYFNETTGDMHFATNDDGSSSAAGAGGGFPHLYSHDVSGAFVDASAIRSIATADVAELHAQLEPDIKIEDDVHVINIATKRALTVTEFKQMFYSRGDDEFSIANVYECPDIDSNILASVWGKRVEEQAVGVLRTNTLKIAPGNDLIAFTPISPPHISTITMNTRIYFTNLGSSWTNLAVNTPYYIVSVGVLYPNQPTAIKISETIGGSAIVPLGGSTSANDIKWWEQVLPFNASRVMNYNKLSSRPNDPSGVDLAYGYANDLQRNFYASHEVMGYLERDLNIKNKHWTLCSRISIEDQLHNLSFAAESSDDVCMTISCARKWSEVEDALAESCLAENNIIGLGDYVDLYINVRVTNGNPNAKDTIIRIRFTVQITRGPDDLGNWNLVAAYIASAILLTGIPKDAPEGGSLQYANASLVKNRTYEYIYVTGITSTNLDGNTLNGSADVFLTKYRSDGKKIWTTQFGSTAGQEGHSVIVDTYKNIYVTGQTTGSLYATSAGSADIFLAKYNSDGIFQWGKQIGSSLYDEARGVAVDSFGNIYITGYTSANLPGGGGGGQPGMDWFVIKYNPNGIIEWVEQNGVSGEDHVARGIAIDSNNKIYIFGYKVSSPPTPPTSQEIFLIKLDDATGSVLWTKNNQGPGPMDHARAIAIDPHDSIFVTGYTTGTFVGTGNSNEGGDDAFIGKYDTNGNVIWYRQQPVWNGPLDDRITGIGTSRRASWNVESDNNYPLYNASMNKFDFFVAGYSNSNISGGGPSFDIYLNKFDGDGNPSIPTVIQMGTTSIENIRGLSVGGDGVYITGFTEGALAGPDPNPNKDMIVIKFNFNGKHQWTRQLGGNGNTRAVSVAADNVLENQAEYVMHSWI